MYDQAAGAISYITAKVVSGGYGEVVHGCLVMKKKRFTKPLKIQSVPCALKAIASSMRALMPFPAMPGAAEAGIGERTFRKSLSCRLGRT